MLSLSKKTDYALLVLTTLAQKPKDYVSLRELAVRKNMPYRFLAQVARALVHDGLIISREGSGGGYRLKKSAKKISVSDVVTAIEGGVALASCLSHSETECELAVNCPLKKGMPSIQRMVLKTLTKKTVADLLAAN
ncbi:MAG: Rrf2 family transcriptional regulator [bacterium]|nr:Rrf2 family transcriptional regulator [bacterium]